MSKSTFQQAAAEYREHLPDLRLERFTTAKNQDAYEYADAFQKNHQPPWLYALTQAWERLYSEPYHGVTSDGMQSHHGHKSLYN